jgi:hypothetical protein
VDPVGGAGGDQVGPVVEQKKGIVTVGCGAKAGGRAHQQLVVAALVAKLDQIDAAGERRLEQRSGILTTRARLADEVKTASGETAPAL